MLPFYRSNILWNLDQCRTVAEVFSDAGSLVHNLLTKIVKLLTTIQQDIAFIVRDIMICRLGLEEAHLRDAALLLDELHVGLPEKLELKLEIENKFCIHISREEVDKIVTVANIILCVQQKMQ